ncbi:hypothetical protein AMECASPLE_037366 [Ameca splendens]|uniref:Uncharacterized protein n=1 Tax=Ameca splendens TaxID=208324 RepID=A0ABV0Y7R5_9TELE
MSEEQNGDRAIEARGLLVQIDLRFVSLLETFTSVLGEIKYLSDVLQSPQLDLGTAVTLVDTLESYREGSLFNDIWDNTVTLTEQCNISAAPPGRQVRPSCLLEGHYLFTPVVQTQVSTEKVYSFQLLMCFSLR